MEKDLKEDVDELKTAVNKFLTLYKLVNSERIQKAKDRLLKSKTKRRIYELCDGKHTVTDITKKLSISQPNVSYHLSTLLESGLVSFREVKGTRYYFKSLE